MSTFRLKVKSKMGQTVLDGLRPESKTLELKTKLSEATNLNPDSLQVLCGFPPRQLDLDNDLTVEELGLKTGDTLIVEEKKIDICAASDNSRPHVFDEENLDDCGILMKKVVPSDNSCLFTSIGFVMGGKVDTTIAPYMRKLIAETVANDSDNYSEAVLGKRNREYCKWIEKPDSWGGAIEISVLANYYGVEMVVVDTMNGILNRFGEDQHFTHRVFLFFDGVHYDPLYVESYDGLNIQTVFPVNNEKILEQALQLAMDAKSSLQFTDVNHFILKCLQCGVMMKGQVEAQEHASQTGHTNFGEVKKS